VMKFTEVLVSYLQKVLAK